MEGLKTVQFVKLTESKSTQLNGNISWNIICGILTGIFQVERKPRLWAYFSLHLSEKQARCLCLPVLIICCPWVVITTLWPWGCPGPGTVCPPGPTVLTIIRWWPPESRKQSENEEKVANFISVSFPLLLGPKEGALVKGKSVICKHWSWDSSNLLIWFPNNHR